MDTMGKFLGHTPNGMGLANAAVLAELLDHLIAKDILKRQEVATILSDAYNALSPGLTIISVIDAMDIVSKLLKRFQENA